MTKAIRNHPSFTELLKNAFGALRNLCVNNDNNRRRFAQAGGVEAVVKAMNDYPFNEFLLKDVCVVLQDLSTQTYEKDHKGYVERRALIANAGGVEAMTKAMQRHPSFEELLKYGCGALRNLCVNNDNNRRRFVQAGGVEAVVKAMNDHPFNEFLLKDVCVVLQDLSTHTDEKSRKECEERRELIGTVGGVEAVTKAMQRHPTFVVLLELACNLLGNLSVDDGSNTRRISLAGGIKIVVDTMKRHALSPKIQEEATKALFNLSSNRDVKRKVAKIATEAVKEAKRRFPQLKYPPLLLKRLNKRRLWRVI